MKNRKILYLEDTLQANVHRVKKLDMTEYACGQWTELKSQATESLGCWHEGTTY